jgi:hypothetical protein
MQSLNVPLFFRAITTPAAYGLKLILITSFANIVRNFSQTFDFNASGVRLEHAYRWAISCFDKMFTSIASPRFTSLLEKRFSCSNSYSFLITIRR